MITESAFDRNEVSFMNIRHKRKEKEERKKRKTGKTHQFPFMRFLRSLNTFESSGSNRMSSSILLQAEIMVE